MCGVFLAYSKKKAQLRLKQCERASNKLFNRGPDFFKSGYYLDKKLFIANTILSITGKTLNNGKILNSNSGRYLISFNGEIYNYKELAKDYLNRDILSKDFSDSEVLVNLYEVLENEKIPEILNGMFSYIIFDNYQKKLIINNDSQGEKNLYYFDNSDFLVVSSTIESILIFLGNHNMQNDTLKNYFGTRHFMPLNNTAFKNVKLFRSGSINFFCLKKNIFIKKIFENSLNWICEKTYNKFNQFSEQEMIDYLDLKLNNQAKLMIPDKRFGSIVSGGIDSSLQSAIITNYKIPYKYCTIDHGSKDHIMSYIKNFNYFFPRKIQKIKLKEKEYIELAKKCYKIVSGPLQTHDLPARLKISDYFRKKNCKVFFSADGCDELFGGQQIYNKVFKNKYNLKINQSPYSTTYNNQIVSKNYKNQLQKAWINTLKKYNFLEDKKEKNIQSSFFLDYFIQSINVANRSNDLISCNNSVEPRNIFVSKNILKIIINLPLKYKFDLKEKNILFRQKKILKKIFCKYFHQKLIYVKSGFSGFPNSLRTKKSYYPLTNNAISINIKKLNKYRNFYYDKKNYFRDMEWKLINNENFLNVFK